MKLRLAHVLYPAFLVGALAYANALLRLDIEPGIAVTLTSLTFGILIFLMERLYPHTNKWKLTKRDFLLDGFHAIFSMGGTTALIKALFLGVLVVASAQLSATIGMKLWPESLPLPLQLLLALFIAEFGAYWVHRICHTNLFFWRIHALHHSSEDLSLMSAGRNHPFSVFAAYGSQMMLLVLAGAPAEVLALQAVFSGINGLLQHANIEMRTGYLRWFFSTPERHHWHHSRAIRESNSNYGSNLIVWDLIFGSGFLPKERRPTTNVGLLRGTRFPNTVMAHLLFPFIWPRIAATSNVKRKAKAAARSSKSKKSAQPVSSVVQ